MTHSREHDALLSGLLAGDVLESDPRVREQLSRCPDCARTWKEARTEMDSLKSAARRSQRAREAAERGGPVPGEERAMEFLRAELARRKPGTAPGDRPPEDVQARAQARPTDTGSSSDAKSPRGADVARDAQSSRTQQPEREVDDGSDANATRRARPRTWPWMALAAALMAIGVVSYLLRPAPDRKDELLGGKSLKVEAPARLADGELHFVWSGEVPAGYQPFAEVQSRASKGAPWTLVWPAPIAEQATHPELRERPLAPGAWIVHEADVLVTRLHPPGSIGAAKSFEVRWRVVPRTNGAANENAASEWSPPSSLP